MLFIMLAYLAQAYPQIKGHSDICFPGYSVSQFSLANNSAHFPLCFPVCMASYYLIAAPIQCRHQCCIGDSCRPQNNPLYMHGYYYLSANYFCHFCSYLFIHTYTLELQANKPLNFIRSGVGLVS